MSIRRDDCRLMRESNVISSLKLYQIFLSKRRELYDITELEHLSSLLIRSLIIAYLVNLFFCSHFSSPFINYEKYLLYNCEIN